MERDDFLKTRYEYHINYYRKVSYFNKKIYLTISWIILILSILLPVAITLQDFIPNCISIILSLILSICFSIQKFINPGEKWRVSREILERLKREKIFYIYEIDEYADSNKLKIFIKKIESIVGSEFEEWQNMQEKISKSIEAKEKKEMSKVPHNKDLQ